MKAVVLTCLIPLAVAAVPAAARNIAAGLSGPVGAGRGARVVRELRIDKPGVYQNIIIDGKWGDHDLVRIRSDNVVLRNCTVRFGRRDAVEVYGRNVMIENCRIHHVLAGSFTEQRDAHGITGRPQGLTVRNCEIAYVSGDCLQFDPSRKLKPYPWDNVLVENCFLWTGPLDGNYAGFKKRERPGENAFDSKTHPDQPRARITLRRCLFKGWGHGQITNGAALNLKEKIQAVVDECVFVENDIAFRCRGTRGGAWVTVRNCAVYGTERVFRLEDRVKNVLAFAVAYGPPPPGRTFRKTQYAGGRAEGAFVEIGGRKAPPLPAWPYDRLDVGQVVSPEGTAAAGEKVVTKAATGFDVKASGLRLASTPGGGSSLAMALFAAAPAAWTVAAPLLLPGKSGTFDETAVKDPTIVRHEGKWHLFYTGRGKDEYATGYVSAATLPGLRTARRFRLKQLRGKAGPYACAPQVLLFEPQKTWYLIYQTRDSNYQPMYSTTKTICKPESWTRPAPLVRKDDKAKWIDFWIICDDTTAYFFYTRGHRDVYVRTTSLQDFPRGFGEGRKVFSGVHEAVHVYRAAGRGEYHMLYELNRGGRRSYGLAVAARLPGPWKKVTDEFATGAQLRYPSDADVWTEMVSHGEMIRRGCNQRLEYDPSRAEFLVQGLLKSECRGPYPSLPWRLGIIRKR